MSKKIKTEKIYQFPFNIDSTENIDNSKGTLNSLQEYDNNGNLILEISYNPDGSISEKNQYSYDDNGKLTTSVIFGEDGDPLESRKITRNDEGSSLKEEITYLDSSVDEVLFTYENGLLKEKIQKTDENEIELREIFDYEGENLVLYEKFDEYDKKVYQLKNSFENGKIVATEIWSSEEEEPFRQVIEYDDQGNRKLELRYNKKDKLIERNIYETDSQGKVTRVTEENPSRKNNTEFSYDGEGRLIHQVEKDMNDAVVSEVNRNYDYDGRLSHASVEYMDRMTGLMRANTFVYEYEYYD